ncbi:unnamed protein product [Brassica oleracea var. botrytis]
MNQTESSANENNPKPAITGETSAVPEWITETIKGGSLRHVDLHTGINGWASPPGDLWNLSSSLSAPPTTSQTNRNLPAETTSSLPPALTGSNPVKNSDNLLTRPDNRGSSLPQTSPSSRRIPKQLHLRRELPSFRQRTLQLGLLLRNGRTDPLRLRPETLRRRRRIVP